MRWFETTSLILIGALIGGAFYFGTDAGTERLFAPSIDRAYHDTYYVVAHQQFMWWVPLALIAVAAAFGLIIWLGRPHLRTLAAITVTLFSLCVALSVIPQHVVSLAGMPRRYVDPSGAYFVWLSIANITSVVAAICAVILIGLLALSIFQRFRRGAPG